MRRKDRELTDKNDIFSVIENCDVVHVAMVDDGNPYIAALNFGYDRRGDDLILYLHSALEGRKLDILKKNPNVCFQMDCAHELVKADPQKPCSFSWNFDSVVGNGRVEFITNADEKTNALNRIIQHLDNSEERFIFPEQMLSQTCIYRIVSSDFTGKRHK